MRKMNDHQADGFAKTPEQQALDRLLIEVVTPKGGREKLPGGYEEKYRSEDLKARIADLGMWSCIPAVTQNMNTPAGIRRLNENEVLFSFIDLYFQNFPFAFEPNMQDGRYVLLPHDVSHQGIGICASRQMPGFLEVGHFWYPAEYTKKAHPLIDQVYIAQYMVPPIQESARQIQAVFSEKPARSQASFCTFPFDPETIVRMDGDFMDNPGITAQVIRNALKSRSPQVQRNGEGLILFMQRLMGSI